MDREKRRSVEKELELDQKIALIRERNLKLEQRLKEVEEDRERDQLLSKTPTKTVAQPPKAATEKKSSREWDKGKTPASTWRENVPSIDLKGKLAGQKKPNIHHNNNNNNNTNNAPPNNNNNVKHPKIPSRLEGRVTFVKDVVGSASGGQQKKKQTQPIGTGTGETHKTGGNIQQQKRNMSGGNGKKLTKQPDIKNRKNNEKKQNDGDEMKKLTKKSRARRESDNYAVKQVVRGVIDKICWLERLEKRKMKKEAEQLFNNSSKFVAKMSDEVDKDGPKKDQENTEQVPEETQKSPDEVVEKQEAEIMTSA